MQSEINKALNLYKQIDEAISSHYKTHKKQPPCKKGCSTCCSQFFEISEVEYAIIDKSLHELPIEAQLELKMKAKKLVESLKKDWPDFYSRYFAENRRQIHDQAYYEQVERLEVTMPCVFLTDSGGCGIYASRPMVCRTTGGAFLHLFNKDPICSIMPVSLFTPLWQADLRHFKGDIDAIRWLPDDSPMTIKRPYPMFFYVHDRFEPSVKQY